MSELFLHAGPSKTGSTFLQSCLPFMEFLPNEEGKELRLVPKLELNCSWLAPSLDPENLLFTDSIRRSQHKIDKSINWIRNSLDIGDVILSGEHFGDMTAAGYRRIKDLVHPHDVRVLLFARPFEQRLLSFWQESLKWGEKRSFFSYVAELHSNLESRQSFSLDSMFQSAASGLGAESQVSITSLSCNPFSTKQLCFTLGSWTNRRIKMIETVSPARNESIDFESAILLVILNHVMANNAARKHPAAAFAVQLSTQRETNSVRRYFLEDLDKVIILLREMKEEELNDLRNSSPNCLEGTDMLLDRLGKDKMSQVIEYFQKRST